MHTSDHFAVIIDAVRSPMGVKRGKMIGIRADDLMAQVVKKSVVQKSKNCRSRKSTMLLWGVLFRKVYRGC